MGIKLNDIEPLKLLLEEGKIACLYCLYYNPKVGCDRIYKQTRGRMKIDIPDPLEKQCEAFQPMFRCEECKYFLVEKMDEAYGGRDRKYTCTKHFKEDDAIKLCTDYTPTPERLAELEEIYKDSGYKIEVV